MPAKDIYHEVVKNALIKDGWTITDDPLKLTIGSRSLYVDLGAEKLIAAQLNPNNPDVVAIGASRMMLERLKNLAQENQSFAFETTLAARSFAPFLRQCQAKGYRVNLIYVWLNSVELAIARVALRVASGGHNIPEDVIRRRYFRGRKNFLELYSKLADRWQIYDNSGDNQLIAYKNDLQIKIVKTDIWQQIINDE